MESDPKFSKWSINEWLQRAFEGAVEEGLEEIIQLAAGVSLLRLHRPNLGDAGGEIALQRNGWNIHFYFYHSCQSEVMIRNPMSQLL